MLRISTLGRLALDDESGPVGGIGSWRPTLGAMALLATSGDQGVPRERLVSLLWPDRSPERGRNSLKQLLSALRRSIPESAITGTAILRLDRALVSCDAWDFQAAVARGDFEAAIAVYAGPFIDGFSIPGAIEFERWAEGERTRLAGEFHRALETLAERASAVGDYRAAVAYMRRLANAEPLDSDVALRLMMTLVASGNRAGALQHFDIHSALVQQQLECAPDPAIAEYAATLRSLPRVAVSGSSSVATISAEGSPAASSAPSLPVKERVSPSLRLVPDDEVFTTEPPDASPAPPEVLAGAPAGGRASATPYSGVTTASTSLAADATAPRSVSPHSVKRIVRRLRRMSAALLALAVAAFLLAVASVARRPEARADRAVAASSVVAVMPFSVQGTADVAYLGNGIADLLSSSLDGAGGLRAVDPRVILRAAEVNGARVVDARAAATLARRVGAEYYVLGKVVEVAGRLRIVAYLFHESGRASPLGQEAVESRPDSVFAAVDELASRLLAERFRMPRERLSRSAAMTTSSLAALKAFLDGETAFRDGRYADAAEHYRRAITIDTTFALAHYRASQAADRTGRDSDVLPALERAQRFAAHLSEQDSLLVSAFAAWRKGRLDDAERLYRAEVADHPDDVEGWFQLGELLFSGNPLRGRTSAEARAPFERVLALDPDDAEALLHLARIASSQGRAAEADSLVQHVLALAPAREVLELRSFRAFALGDRQGQKRVTNELLASPGSIPAATALGAAVYAGDVERVERFGRLLTEDRHSADVRGYGHRLLAQTAAARGQWHAAERELVAAARFDPTATLELRSLLAVLPFLPVPRADLEELRSTLDQWRPPADESADRIHSTAHLGMHPALRLHRLGLVSARLGDTAAALRYARQLESTRDADDDSVAVITRETFARSIEARVVDAAGQPERALSLLEQAQWQPIASGFMAEALDRYYRADLLRRLGRIDEARGWYRSIAERTTYELVYLAPARLQLAQMAEAQGATDLAIERYRNLIGAWRNADPELAPLVQDARRRLTRLGG